MMTPIAEQGPETRSADVVGTNVEALKGLFPEAFTEGRIDFEVLKQLLGGAVEEREEKYGLNWHGKRQARQLALAPSTGTLRPAPEDSVDWDTTQNLMIEGDNLEVLKLLQKSYAGKVKMIYIDPPYNTGGDFVYPDKFKDNISNYLELTGQVGEGGSKLSTNSEVSGRFHTTWLNMLYPRLKLAWSLLNATGVILISIDDHEVDNLRIICAEIFGEENFVASITWEKGRKNDAKLISTGHEYVLIYAKSLAHLRELNTVWREEKPGSREIWEKYLELRSAHGTNNAEIEVDLQLWFAQLPKGDPSKKWSRYKRIDANGPWRDRDISWPGGGGPRYDLPHPVTKIACEVPERGWIYATVEEMQRQIKIGVVEFRNDHTQPPFRKAHLRPLSYELLEEADQSNDEEEDVTESENDDELATQVRGTYFYKQSQVTVKALRKLMGAKVFDNPKDFTELARLFNYVTGGDQSALILDFFAGSGSTAQAVVSLNQEDQGTRRYALVQFPEPLDSTSSKQRAAAAYCERLGKPMLLSEITKERLRRLTPLAKREGKVGGDLGFRVFKLDSTNIRPWEPNRDKLAETLEESVEHIKAGRSEQDILFEVLLKLGLELTVPIETRTIAEKTVYSVGLGALLVCLAERIDAGEVEALALGMVEWHTVLAPAAESTVVFRDSAFADDVAKTNMTAILGQHGLENVRSL